MLPALPAVQEPLMGGITLDQYMSRLVTTPASLAATSGRHQGLTIFSRVEVGTLRPACCDQVDKPEPGHPCFFDTSEGRWTQQLLKKVVNMYTAQL
jgi:hypothetical protein